MKNLVPEEPPQVPPAAMDLIGEIASNERLLGISQEKARRRVTHHWAMFGGRKDGRSASLLLGAVIDLPARWIEDIWSGRR
jgi:hypothetical protein